VLYKQKKTHLKPRLRPVSHIDLQRVIQSRILLPESFTMDWLSHRLPLRRFAGITPAKSLFFMECLHADCTAYDSESQCRKWI